MTSIEDIKKLADLNMSVSEICNTLQISRYEYSKITKSSAYKKPKVARKRLEDIDEILVELKTTRNKKKDICKKYNISFGTLQAIEKDNGIKV